VALKRASLFGRAPARHDLEIAFTTWGYLDSAPAELVELRRPMFEGVHDAIHYSELRSIVAAVPESTLRLTPSEVKARHQSDWHSLLELDA
jgi:hypothetical protein